jgi:hypothetical protein
MCQEEIGFFSLAYRSGFSENRGTLITTPLLLTKARRTTNPSPPLSYAIIKSVSALSTVKIVQHKRQIASCYDITDSIIREQHGTLFGR